MPQSTQTQQQLYSHAAEPKAVQQRRAKYREDDPSAISTNIMFDRRVVRGNTYAARVLPAEPVLHLTSKAAGSSAAAAARRAPGRSRAIPTPEPVDGRRHMDVQTDVYLEELTDVVPEADTTTQTDAFLDRPPTPQFVPTKSGLDAATQIEQGELFDFDAEVEPLLEVLVGKVLEQALMEVLEEEEIAALQQHQAHFEAIRSAELVAAQRLEAAERRKMEEKERRVKQERERKERERVVRAKVAASTFARGYLNGIVKSVFQQLQDTGYFYDPVEREVEAEFLPWLTQQAGAHVERGLLARSVVAALVQQDAAALADAQAAAAEAYAAKASRKAQAGEAEAGAIASAAELADIRAKATFILSHIQPPIARQEQVDAVRAELVAKSGGDAEATFEAERARVGDEKRAELEAQLAAAAAEAEAAATAAEANGEEPPASKQPQVDVEAEVEAAMAAVQRSTAAEVTDGDVLSALLEQGVVTKEAIVHGLAVHMLGSDAYTQQE
ncbi:radial spoke protein 3-domain-containing protein [Scenedesmus sp. NREL 46B-D3]|nr:radial spoke protein 3-domain-containing protein [Scenedesmus sp. NREL 46B-D3]